MIKLKTLANLNDLRYVWLK